MEFYSPNCGHCQEFAPTVEKIAQGLDGSVKVGGVNCDSDRDLCTKHQVTSLPTVKLLVGGKVIDYEGRRAAKEIHEFMAEHVPSTIANIRRVEQAQDFLTKAGSKKTLSVVLFTSKFDTSMLYKSLAYQFRDSMSFGEVRASNVPVSARYGVTEYPTLLVFCQGADDSTIVEYKGKFAAKELRSFLSGLKDVRGCLSAAKAQKRPRPAAASPIDLNQDFKSMRVAQLRRLLEERGVECVGCIEREDYIRKIHSLGGK